MHTKRVIDQTGKERRHSRQNLEKTVFVNNESRGVHVSGRVSDRPNSSWPGKRITRSRLRSTADRVWTELASNSNVCESNVRAPDFRGKKPNFQSPRQAELTVIFYFSVTYLISFTYAPFSYVTIIQKYLRVFLCTAAVRSGALPVMMIEWCRSFACVNKVRNHNNKVIGRLRETIKRFAIQISERW